MGISRKSVDIIALALGSGGEFFDQLWHQQDHIVDDFAHRLTYLDAAIEDPVEQIFHRPRQLTDNQRTNHAPAALERVEGAAHFGQGFVVVVISVPARQVLANRLKHLGGLLDEDLKQLFINRLLIFRRRQQTRRNILCRWIDGDDGSGHYIIETDCRLAAWQSHHELRQDDFGHAQPGHLGFAPLHQVVERLRVFLLLRFSSYRLDSRCFSKGRILFGIDCLYPAIQPVFECFDDPCLRIKVVSRRLLKHRRDDGKAICSRLQFIAGRHIDGGLR